MYFFFRVGGAGGRENISSATACFITKGDSFFSTKWDKCYYKVRQVFHSAIGITKWDDYYKVRQVLF